MKRLILIFGLIFPLAGAVSQPEGMFQFYEHNRTANRPNYITEDFLLLSHMMILDRVTAEFEEQTVAPALAGFARDLETRLRSEEGDVRLARDFAAILEALCSNAQTAAAAPDAAEAAAELQRIASARGIERSPLFRQTIDYTQFQPRGHYTRSPALTNYFRAYRFASSILFPVLESRSTGISTADADLLTSQAAAIAHAISSTSELRQAYETLNSRFEFLFGPADDLTASDYTGMAASPDLKELRRQLLALEKRPRIIGGVVNVALLEPQRTVYDVLTGFRLLPQRFSADAAALGDLVYPRVGRFQGAGAPFTAGPINGETVKAFPAGKELMALLGSKYAQLQLEHAGDTRYENYAAARTSAASALDSATGLLRCHLQLLNAWLRPNARVPANRRLTSALAYWTYYRYSGVLYIKQSYTGESKGLSVPARRPGAWIEPAPELYLLLRRQAALVDQQLPHPILKAWQEALDRCIDISYAAMRRTKLADDQEDYLNELDKSLAPLTGQFDHPIVVDVHTDPNSEKVVEEAIGFPVAVQAAGKPAMGALFSHREFKQPLQRRLNDDSWLEQLRGRSASRAGIFSERFPQGSFISPGDAEPGRRGFVGLKSRGE